MTLRLHKRQVDRMAAKLAIAMLVADLAGRARVLLEAELATGRRFQPAKGLSFSGSRGGEADSTTLMATSAPVSFAEEGETQVLAPAKLEPKAALDFFRQKLAMTRPAFNKLARRYRDAAFTVANVESVKLIEEIQSELDQAIAQGLTQEQFRKAVDARLRSAGLQPLNPFHLETVFRTNVASAYGAGRASQMLQPEVRRALPWWEYRTVGDSRVRDEHEELNGFIARWDDPVWQLIFPPWDYNCRCKVRALTEAEAQARAKASGQDISRPGRDRLPADFEPRFQHPMDSLAMRAKGQEPAAAATLTAKEITAKAVKLRERSAEAYTKLRDEAERLKNELRYQERRVARSKGKFREWAERDLAKVKPQAETAERAWQEYRAKFVREVHELVRPAEGRSYKFNPISRVDRKRRLEWETGLREFGRLVGVGPKVAEAKFKAQRGSRSFFMNGTATVHMTKGAKVRVVVHELGHWLERLVPGVHEAAKAFLERRTRGEAAVSLRKLTGSAYKSDEVTKRDKFLHPYMGKIYRHAATEIISMGVEWLYDDPYKLLDDPDYFEFLIGVLHGEGIN